MLHPSCRRGHENTEFGMVKMESLWMFIHVDSCSILDWFKEFVRITVQFFSKLF